MGSVMGILRKKSLLFPSVSKDTRVITASYIISMPGFKKRKRQPSVPEIMSDICYLTGFWLRGTESYISCDITPY